MGAATGPGIPAGEAHHFAEVLRAVTRRIPWIPFAATVPLYNGCLASHHVQQSCNTVFSANTGKQLPDKYRAGYIHGYAEAIH